MRVIQSNVSNRYFVSKIVYIWDEMKPNIRPKTEASIAEAIAASPKGRVLFVDDFEEYGNPESVKKALHRLQEKGILVRLAHGVYLNPKMDPELGILYPSTDDIARAIARRDKARIVTTGIMALNKLGLSPQVPMRVVYLTDGAPRSIQIGKRTIVFKRTSPKNLLMKGDISSLAIQALRTIGQRHVDTDTIQRIQVLLQNETKENILHDAKLAPAWIASILRGAVT